MPRNATEVGQVRTYTLPDGTTLPSVTTILKAWPADWMGPWAAKMVAERAIGSLGELVDRAIADMEAATKWLKVAPWEKRDASAEAGTNYHAYLQGRMEGDAPEPGDPYKDHGLVAIDAFIDAYRPEPLHIEAQIANTEHGYAGSSDLFARIYGRTGLIDLKTGTIGYKDRLQLAAYRRGRFFADGEWLGDVPQVDFCAILHVPKDDPASWQLIEVEAGDAEFDDFLAVQKVWLANQANKKGIGGTLILPQALETE